MINYQYFNFFVNAIEMFDKCKDIKKLIRIQ